MGRITTVCYEYKLVEECAGSASRLDNSSQRWIAMKTTARLINVMPWEALRVACNVCRAAATCVGRGQKFSGKTGFTGFGKGPGRKDLGKDT